MRRAGTTGVPEVRRARASRLRSSRTLALHDRPP
jgi:hypothetical protein